MLFSTCLVIIFYQDLAYIISRILQDVQIDCMKTWMTLFMLIDIKETINLFLRNEQNIIVLQLKIYM